MVKLLLLTLSVVILGIPTSTSAQTATSSATTDLTNLIPTEIMSCANSGESEWLELWNGGDESISIDGWYVLDAADNKRELSGSLPPQQTTVLEWSGSLLNNSGDTLSLFTETEYLVFSVSLGSCSSGQSWLLGNQTWILSDEPTPGEHTFESSQSTTQQSNSYTHTSTTTSSQQTGSSNQNLDTQHSTSAETSSPKPSLSPKPTYSQEYFDKIEASVRKLQQDRQEKQASNSAVFSDAPLSPLPSAPTEYQPQAADKPLRQAFIGVILSGTVIALLTWWLLQREIKRATEAAQEPPELPQDTTFINLD